MAINLNNRKNVLLRCIVGPSLFKDKNELRNKVIGEFHKCLLKMDISSRLVIIDPYLYMPNKDEGKEKKIERAKFFISMFRPCIESLEKLVIIFANKIDLEFKTLLDAEFKAINSNLEIVCYRSNIFHDRFVFNPLLVNGIALGASFNGILKNTNRFDNISSEEAEDLERLLYSQNLL